MSNLKSGVRGVTGEPPNKRARYESNWILASTDVKQESFGFRWTLNNYSFLKVRTSVCSPSFLGGPKSQHRWFIRVHHKEVVDGTGYFSCYLALEKFGKMGVRKVDNVRFRFCLLDVEGQPWTNAPENISTINSVTYDSPGEEWGIENFLRSEDLRTLNFITEEDSVTVRCEVWIEQEPQHVSWRKGDKRLHKFLKKQIERQTGKHIREDIAGLLVSGLNADVKLETTTKTFLCHKAILAGRSSVFKAMFSGETNYSLDNPVVIKNFQGDVVKTMLQFIYGSHFEVYENTEKLMEIADTYNLADLKKECMWELEKPETFLSYIWHSMTTLF